ncbi:MAG: FAD-dependent oxidoreductase [Candidatus Omnitrophota bacterium]
MVNEKLKNKPQKAIIFGAGPAGLTLAHELLTKTNIQPLVFETQNIVGGLCRTIDYKGNRLDIGGHRYFTTSQKILKWWLKALPLNIPAEQCLILKKRISRIVFGNAFIRYPLKINHQILKALGFRKIGKILLSYLKSQLFPRKQINSLEDLLIMRFGEELYRTFFQDYTQKVWGLPCNLISAQWAKGRIQSVSIKSILDHAIKKVFPRKALGLMPGSVPPSLTEQFLYPAKGAGQLWETIAARIIEKGGKIFLGHKMIGLNNQENIHSAKIMNLSTKKISVEPGDYFISSIPLGELVSAFENKVPESILSAAEKLIYRNVIIVGLILKKSKLNVSKRNVSTLPDQWIYIHNKDIAMGRLQIFNNWSEFLVKDKEHVLLGAEYFCSEESQLWEKQDDVLVKQTIRDLARLDFIDPNDFIDGVVIRQEKAYPVHGLEQGELAQLGVFINTTKNLFLIGRNGQHEYCNTDAAMLSAMEVAEKLANGAVNTHA